MPSPTPSVKPLDDPSYFFNRELSFLEFNRRILAMAKDATMPLLERLRFLCIVSSNLDEFFEVRVAGLIQKVRYGSSRVYPDALAPEEALAKVSAVAHELIQEQYRHLNEELQPALEEEGVRFLRRSEWTEEQKAWAREYFYNHVRPVIQPLSLDPAHPFPTVQNKGLNFAVTLEGQDAFGRSLPFAIIQAPRVLPRVIEVPGEIAGPNDFIFLSSVIHKNVASLFPGLEVTGFHQFRVTRNSELFVDEEEVENLLQALAVELPHRPFGEAVRLEVADSCPEYVTEYLLRHFKLHEGGLYRVKGPVNLSRLAAIIDMVDRPDLVFPPFQSSYPAVIGESEDIFEAIRKGPILLHHPYQSFNPVVEFVRQASQDPQVLAIKQTLYRTTPDSPIVDALVEAAAGGKQVTAVVELKARFDEANNIRMAEKLGQVGAQVVYGIVNHKTHAKMSLVVRKEEHGLRLYGHLGTGNYHPRTARFYTDVAFFTCDQDITSDMNEVFMLLTGMAKAPTLKKLRQSPFSLHKEVVESIQRETEIAKNGGEGRVIARMNSLLEKDVIIALYQASQAGVKVDLVVRGICALRPGVPGVSDNIRVLSVVGRFLEHSRVFYFGNGGQPKIWTSSADWMERNFFKRVELMAPVEEPVLVERLRKETLDFYLEDNCQAWELQSDGSYQRRRPAADEQCLPAQNRLMNRLGDMV